MKMLSKKWIIAAVVMAIICFAAIPVFAEENVIQISSDLSLVREGDTFEVTVTYGGNFNGVDMRLSYNGDLLAIEDEGSGIANAIISDHENTVYMNASAVNAMSAKNGNMLTVCFKAKEGQSGHGDIALTIKDLFLNDADYNPVDLNYEIRNEIENQGGVNILSREEKENETISVVKTSGGTAQITGLPENTTISITDLTENTEHQTLFSENMKTSALFKDAEKADLLMIYDITSGETGFVNGKGTVTIPLTENQKGYDSYYVGREVNGEILWQKAQLKDGNVVFTTDRLGEVAIVGVKGNDKVSGAYEEKNGAASNSVFPAVIGIAAILLILAGILIYKKVKKDKKSQEE